VSARLDEKDRRFFALVARAAFANPFSIERADLDGAIAETWPEDPEVLARVSARVEARLNKLSKNGHLPLSTYDEADQELVFAAVLFDAFHRFAPALDAFITLEGRGHGEPSRVAFARDLLQGLQDRGVPAPQAIRMLELFYQMKRAHSAVASRLIGNGPSMRRLREDLWNSLFTRDIRRYERFLWNRLEDFSTLLSGETGTGKGEAAQALGLSGFIPFDAKRERFSERFTALFLPIHLAEYPETLIESELFGHRKGAFTGAIEHHDGVLTRTKPHGTLFLDEIGEVSLPIQVKLLRVLQERTFVPVGGREPQRFAGRIVAATHRSLSSMRSEGRLRDDFFYRLGTQCVELPSLRTRLMEAPEELALLVDQLCARILGEASPGLAAEVRTCIGRDLGSDYPFPGNVRELEQCVRRVLLTGGCKATTAGEPTKESPLETPLRDLAISAEELLKRYCGALYERHRNYVHVAQITGLDRRTVKKYAGDDKTT
jgi:sigma-54 specific flagellar transcriptional regulator A